MKMAKMPFACGECHMILNDGLTSALTTHLAPVSSDWTGYVIIVNPERSKSQSDSKSTSRVATLSK